MGYTINMPVILYEALVGDCTWNHMCPQTSWVTFFLRGGGAISQKQRTKNLRVRVVNSLGVPSIGETIYQILRRSPKIPIFPLKMP